MVLQAKEVPLYGVGPLFDIPRTKIHLSIQGLVVAKIHWLWQLYPHRHTSILNCSFLGEIRSSHRVILTAIQQLVVTASGPDRPGIVARLTKRVLECGGNVAESRMARLAGDFTILMLITFDVTSCSKPWTGVCRTARKAEQLQNSLLQIEGLQPATPETAAKVEYPENINFRNMAYFMMAPTLCYQLSYPRSNTVRKGWVLRQIGKLLVFVGLMGFITEQYINPTIKNSQHPLKGNPLLSSQHQRPAPPSDTSEGAAESLEKVREATASEMSERALEEERRLSVLEYVWKLEEELHQQAGRRPAATPAPTTGGRSKSVGVSRSKTQSPVERTMSSEETATNAAATMMCAITDNDQLWQRLYEDGKTTNERHLDAFSSEEQDGNVTSHIQHTLRVDEGRNKERQQEAGTSMLSGEETLDNVVMRYSLSLISMRYRNQLMSHRELQET
ncbi:unnamed protein product [Sphagnum compactum]